MAGKLLGVRYWDVNRDDEGNRVYTVRNLVETSLREGPQTAMVTPGLPVIGGIWGYGGDFDPWAFCTPYMRVTAHIPVEGEPHRYWIVEQRFSTRPLLRCQDEEITDPLLEPPKLSGSFTKYTEESGKDRNDNKIKNSAFELVRGPQVEVDKNRPTVIIEHNVAKLGLEQFSEMVDTVNDRRLWGLDKRKIKLSNVSWERMYFGICGIYYTRRFEFEINFNTFDREVLDEGTKAFGKWDKETGLWTTNYNFADGPPPVPLDKTNPGHADQYKDIHGENAHVVLNGAGEPLGAGQDPVGIPNPTTGDSDDPVEFYPESNFLLLGIPTIL